MAAADTKHTNRALVALHIVAPALCDALLALILDAALDRDHTRSALCLDDREAAIISTCDGVQTALAFMQSIDPSAAQRALDSCGGLGDWSVESLRPSVDEVQSVEGAHEAAAVRTLIVGHYGGSAQALPSAQASLARILEACTGVETLVILGKVSDLGLTRPLLRCRTVAIVRVSWPDLDALLPFVPGLETLHVDALHRRRDDGWDHTRWSSGANEVMARLESLSLGIGSCEDVTDILQRCGGLRVRTEIYLPC